MMCVREYIRKIFFRPPNLASSSTHNAILNVNFLCPTSSHFRRVRQNYLIDNYGISRTYNRKLTDRQSDRDFRISTRDLR